MKKNIIIILVFSIIFLLGVYVGNYKIFPYQALKVIKNTLVNFGNPNYKKYSEYYRYSNLKNKLISDCPVGARTILILGQSNAANSVNTLTKKSEKHFMYFKGNCYKLSEPVLGATGNYSSITSELAEKINSTQPIIFLNNAWGGTSITDWSKNNSPLSAYTNKNITDLYNNYKVKIDYFVFIQGENDRFSYSNKKINYSKHFKKMQKNIFKNLDENLLSKTKFIITQTSFCDKNFEGIKKSDINLMIDKDLTSQQEKMMNEKNTFTSISTDKYGYDYRLDGCHFNSFGVREITNELSKIINTNFNK